MRPGKAVTGAIMPAALSVWPATNHALVQLMERLSYPRCWRAAMTSLIEQIIGEAETEPAAVELVTLTSEQLTHGVMSGNPLPFPDLRSAVSFARTMLPPERESSWIRTANDVLTLAQAEARLKAEGEI